MIINNPTRYMKEDWNLFGEELIDNFNIELFPNNLLSELSDYRNIFGNDFTIDNLLKIYDIKAKIFIAGAIKDMPEYLLDQIGKYRNNLPNIVDSLESIASNYK